MHRQIVASVRRLQTLKLLLDCAGTSGLPLWVVDIPQGEEDFPSRKVVRPEDRARMRQRFRSMRPGPASLKELPPIDVVVR